MQEVEEQSSGSSEAAASVVATYEGAWEADLMEGQGVIRWPLDSRAFYGTFMAGRIERGFLVTCAGSALLTFSESCGKVATDTGEVPSLPREVKRQDMGMITGDLMLAIKSGASEGYRELAHAARLSVSDRIKILDAHAVENPPEMGRQALKVKYVPGATDAAASILRALLQPQAPEQHSPRVSVANELSGPHLISVAKSMQWAIEIEKPEPPGGGEGGLALGRVKVNRQVGSSTARVDEAVDEGGQAMLKEQLKHELKARGLHCGGTKAVLQARMDEALARELHEAQNGAADAAEVLARERVLHAAELKVPMLQKELQKRGLKSTGLKHELVARLVGDMDRDEKRAASLPEVAAAAADEVQDMFSEAARGLAGLEVSTTADVLPLKLSAAGSLQPEPLACSKERMLELRKWYEALGRLMGGALWHRKTLPVPFSRFFCRRILEMVPTFRLKAYSAAGAGPHCPGSVAALIGTRVTVLRDDGLVDESRWKHSPHPRLVTASPGISSYVVKEARWCAGTCFT
jgi:hypothetical protein